MMATTPTLWAPSWVNEKVDHRLQISLVDISRAYFHARVEVGNPLFVELPPEDEDYGKGLCERLDVHMYGTRPAAEGWHNECATTMTE